VVPVPGIVDAVAVKVNGNDARLEELAGAEPFVVLKILQISSATTLFV